MARRLLSIAVRGGPMRRPTREDYRMAGKRRPTQEAGTELRSCAPSEPRVSTVSPEVLERFEEEYSRRLSEKIEQTRESRSGHARVECTYRLD